jgi:signal transduction histidine kinase/ActR/RegA family two-component response regulator
LIYLESSAESAIDLLQISGVLWKVFFALLLIIGVVAWLFVLTQQSRRAAEAETQRQTDLLMQEIEAHHRTDKELQRAKEVAEAANLAKSRYVVGLSHELRSPLNAISGYAQLLENDATLAQKPRDQVRVVKRSADHLSGLIDGILDISKIEAGRLYLSRDEVRLDEFLDQLVGMFRLQANAKGLSFDFVRPQRQLPVVHVDEKRLRQILINLLSNAIKFTTRGGVRFALHFRNPVAEFEVSDTGPGIATDDLERIFAPFERGMLGAAQPSSGTGLGLTISRALAGVMGGDIRVSSTVGHGSSFRLKLLLSEVSNPKGAPNVDATVVGYLGPRKTILITDDDPTHRELLREALSPRGFIVLSATDGNECLQVAEHCQPDLFMLDISMPGLSGWQVAERLRAGGHRDARILMISASALEAHRTPLAQPFHDGYLIKPVDLARMLTMVGQLLGLQWTYGANDGSQPVPMPPLDVMRAIPDIDELIAFGRMGHIKGLQRKLDELQNAHPEQRMIVSYLRELVDDFDLSRFMASLGAGQEHESRS